MSVTTINRNAISSRRQAEIALAHSGLAAFVLAFQSADTPYAGVI